MAGESCRGAALEGPQTKKNAPNNISKLSFFVSEPQFFVIDNSANCHGIPVQRLNRGTKNFNSRALAMDEFKD
jgi:hypothetical protein